MATKTIKVAEATNTQLDWLVAKCQGYFNGQGQQPSYWESADGVKHFLRMRAPHAPHHGGVSWTRTTENWSEMGPIIEREDIALSHGNSKADPDNRYEASIIGLHPWAVLAQGPTKLIAAARCYVASKMGETVEVPEALT